ANGSQTQRPFGPCDPSASVEDHARHCELIPVDPGRVSTGAPRVSTQHQPGPDRRARGGGRERPAMCAFPCGWALVRETLHREPVGVRAIARHYVGDLIYGANDGLITTFAVVAGVSGGQLSSRALIIVGAANL